MGLDVTTCFAPLLRWLRAWWPPERQVVLAMDASTLGQRFTGLGLRGVERGERRHDALSDRVIYRAWLHLSIYERGECSSPDGVGCNNVYRACVIGRLAS